MDDSAELYREWNQRSKAAKRRNMEIAEAFWAGYPEIPWVKPTAYHWQLMTLGGLINYWPSTNKWQFQGATRVGGPKRLKKLIDELGTGEIDG